MERPKRKAINFDLDTTVMREIGMYPDGYRVLGVSLKKYGFEEHRQGSGYASKDKITSDDVAFAIKQLVKDCPWIGDCVKQIDVTDIGKQYDLTVLLKSVVEEQKNIHKNEETQIEQRSMNTDVVATTMVQCDPMLSFELAREKERTQKENPMQQVGQVEQSQQVQKAERARQVGQVKQKSKSNNGSTGKR